MDDGNIGQQIIIILILIIANGIFAMTEMSIISARKPRLEQKAEEGNKNAKVALELAEDPNLMFSTVQTGITLIGIVTGLYGGATLSEPLARFIKTYIPFMSSYADAISPLFIVTVITYLSIVVGELTPKRLAVSYAEPIAIIVARPMRGFSFMMKPIVLFLSGSSTLLLRIMGITPRMQDPVSEEEIKIMLSEGAAAGAFEEEEPELVDNIFRLADTTVSDVMVPRPQLEWINIDEEEEDIRRELIEAQHYRLPVGREGLDEVLGLINVSDIFTKQLETNSHVPLKELVETSMKMPLMVAESISLVKLLNLFRTEGVHEALVLDEYGSLSGIVTLHDIMEEIVGLMPTTEEERIEEENRIIKRSDGSWFIDGLMDVEEFREYFKIDAYFPGEEDDYFKTIGGFVTYAIGRIPKETDKVFVEDFTFEVADMDNTRVDKLILTRNTLDKENIQEILDRPV